MNRLAYYRRIIAAYTQPNKSQLSFWHGTPEINVRAPKDRLGEYHMSLRHAADYPGPFDDTGVPKLDYRGGIGQQYNPLATAQYGLAHYNRYRQTGAAHSRHSFLVQARWLRDTLAPNGQGVPVWSYQFDWEYREPLRAPWYSGLAQGQAVSALVRAHAETGDPGFLDAARSALRSFEVPLTEGGIAYRDRDGHLWFEEAIVDPPTHVLNGFIWASWGLFDFHLHTGDERAGDLFAEAVQTLLAHLPDYDVGYWSLYELGHRLSMVASTHYHKLHVVQLRVMHRLTGEHTFLDFADRWEAYLRSRWGRVRSQARKALFKLLYY